MHNLYFPISFAVVYFYGAIFIYFLPELNFPYISYLLFTAFSPLQTVLLIQRSTDNIVQVSCETSSGIPCVTSSWEWIDSCIGDWGKGRLLYDRKIEDPGLFSSRD